MISTPVEILLAEDSPTQAQRLAHILQQQGYQTTITTNGLLALEAAQRRMPTMIISDVVMPEMDGYELCRRVKADQNLADIPVILVTTLSDPHDVIRGLECGADNFILKPYDERHLLGRVQFVLINREMRQADQPGMGIEIYFEGQKHFITADRLQILNLLLSTYEAAMQRNRELTVAEDNLRRTNSALQEFTVQLEQRVLERTQDLEKINHALRDSEARVRLIIDTALDAVLTIDAQGIIRDWNAQAEVIFGWKHEEAVGRSMAELIVPVHYREGHARGLKHFLDTGEGHLLNRRIEISALRRDGQEFPIELAIAPVKTNGTWNFNAFVRDITERKRAEEALQEQAKILDLAPVLIRDPEGRILFWNTGAQKMYGWNSEEALGKIGHSLLKTEFQKNLEEINAQLLTEGHWEGEVSHIRKDGRRIFVASHWVAHRDDHGQLTAVLEVNNDITPLKQVENALRASEERLQLAIESTGLGTWELDPRTGERRWSDQCKRIFGLATEAEVNGEKLFQCIHPQDRPRLDDSLASALQPEGTGEVHTQIRILVGEEKAVRWIETHGRAIFANGEVVRLIGTVLDITERKLAEEEIRKLNEELEQRVVDRTAQLEAANKELEAFSYSVSHDLRAPLRHINGYSQALLEDYAAKLDDVGGAYLRELRGASQEMAQLIDDLLELARVTRTEMQIEFVNLSELADSVVSQLQKENAGRTTTANIQQGMFARGDKRLFRVMLSNLLGNAWKFTEKRQQPEIAFGQLQSNGEHVFFIRDNGAGFDMAYVSRLFGAFQRLHTATDFEGTGIGLATVQRIINRHGGRVWAEGAINQGATFYFTLPTSGGER